DAARSVEDLGEALGDCVLAVAASARTGGLFRRQTVTTPKAIMPTVAAAAANGPVALVFGPEATGLTTAEVSRCQHLITIPAEEDYPVLNLAQAVAVCVYELHQATLAAIAPIEPAETAPLALQERMYEKLEK